MRNIYTAAAIRVLIIFFLVLLFLFLVFRLIDC